jgi:general secretion pathway protein G
MAMLTIRKQSSLFLVPLNSDYDFYSMGKDGKSQAPFSAKASHDDLVRANDGEFVGLVSEFLFSTDVDHQTGIG